MVKKRDYSIYERREGEGYREYPSPNRGLVFSQSSKRYFIDTTDLCFDQGDCSLWEGIPLASSGAMSSMWALEVVGTWVCLCLF